MLVTFQGRDKFDFACFAGCFRLSWSNGNKKIRTTTRKKNTPRGEQTSYLLDNINILKVNLLPVLLKLTGTIIAQIVAYYWLL